MDLLESLFIDMSTPPVASTEIPAVTEATPVGTVASTNATQSAGASPVVSSSFGPPVASFESTLLFPRPNDSTAIPIHNQHSAVPVGINSPNVQQSTASFGVAYGQVRKVCQVTLVIRITNEAKFSVTRRPTIFG